MALTCTRARCTHRARVYKQLKKRISDSTSAFYAMDELRAAFLHWSAYAEDRTTLTLTPSHDPYVEQSVRAQQPKIGAIAYRPPGTATHVVPARVVALLLTALEAIAIYKEDFDAECARQQPYVCRDGCLVHYASCKADLDRRASDQKALIRGYLRQLKPFIFEESTLEAPQQSSNA